MDDRRFDALARASSRRSDRRLAVLGGLGAALGGLGIGRARFPDRAQDVATPEASPMASPEASPMAPPGASPVASPGPLDLLRGTPQAGSVLARTSDAECRVATDPCTVAGCERYCPGG